MVTLREIAKHLEIHTADPFLSYANSVVQCLFYSDPFREHVVNYPARLSTNHTAVSEASPLKKTIAASAVTADVETAQRINEQFGLVPVRRQTPGTPASPISGNSSPEPNKDSFDWLKKQVIATGPFYIFEGTNFADYGMHESLFTGLKDLFEAMIAHEARTGVISPAKFLDTLRSNFELYRSPQHQDAHEFLNLVLNEVVEKVGEHSREARQPLASTEASTKPREDLASTPGPLLPANTSWVHDLFEGLLTSETRCLTCETVSQRDEIFLDLSVDLEEDSSVTSCLRKFSEEEMLRERDKFHCDKCGGLQEAEKRMKIKRLPKILALHLKRFKYVEELGRLLKLFHRVTFPFYLRLLNTTDDAEDQDRMYELYAVIVHLGFTPFHGHYVSIIKTKLGGWLLFDDELVLPVDKEYIKNYFGGDPRNPASAYVLFYKETTVEEASADQDADEPPPPPDEVIKATKAEAAGLGIRVDDPASHVLGGANGVLKTPGLDIDDPFTPPSARPSHAGAPIRNGQLPVPANGQIAEEHAVTPDPTAADNQQAAAAKSGKGLGALRMGSLKIRTSSASTRQRPRIFGRDRGDNAADAFDESAVEDGAVPPTTADTARHPRFEKLEKSSVLNRLSLSRRKPPTIR